jgi:hypothetical protein
MNPHTAGAMASLIVLAYFTYGHGYNLLSGGEREIGWLLPLYAVLIAAGMALIVWKRRAPFFRTAAPYANLIAAVLVVLTLPALIGYYVRGVAHSARAADTESLQVGQDQIIRACSTALPGPTSITSSSTPHPAMRTCCMTTATTIPLFHRGAGAARLLCRLYSRTPYPITVPSMLSAR